MLILIRYVHLPSWWNGRHEGLKILCQQWCLSSSLRGGMESRCSVTCFFYAHYVNGSLSHHAEPYFKTAFRFAVVHRFFHALAVNQLLCLHVCNGARQFKTAGRRSWRKPVVFRGAFKNAACFF